MTAPRRPRLDTVDYGERPRMIVDTGADANVGTPPEPTPEKGQANRTPARRGKRAVAFWLDPAAHKQLRTLALRLDTNLQALMEEACNDLFRRHAMHRIAQETEGSEHD